MFPDGQRLQFHVRAIVGSIGQQRKAVLDRRRLWSRIAPIFSEAVCGCALETILVGGNGCTSAFGFVRG